MSQTSQISPLLHAFLGGVEELGQHLAAAMAGEGGERDRQDQAGLAHAGRLLLQAVEAAGQGGEVDPLDVGAGQLAELGRRQRNVAGREQRLAGHPKADAPVGLQLEHRLELRGGAQAPAVVGGERTPAVLRHQVGRDARAGPGALGVLVRGLGLHLGGVQLVRADHPVVDRQHLVHDDVGDQRFAQEVGQHVAQAVQAIGLAGEPADVRLGDDEVGLRDTQEEAVRADLAAQRGLHIVEHPVAPPEPAGAKALADGVQPHQADLALGHHRRGFDLLQRLARVGVDEALHARQRLGGIDQRFGGFGHRMSSARTIRGRVRRGADCAAQAPDEVLTAAGSLRARVDLPHASAGRGLLIWCSVAAT